MNIRNKIMGYAWLALLLVATPALATDDEGVRYYVSLGTSLAVGVQPNAAGLNQVTDEGYADQLYAAIAQQHRKLKLVKFGCPGETTTSMVDGGICTYPKGSQLAQALKFLHAHKDHVALVTIDIGVNDILAEGCIVGTSVNFQCINSALVKIATNLPAILYAVREATHPDTPIVGMNYYNSFLASWLSGPDGQLLALQSAGLADVLNFNVLGPTYAAFGMPVANVSAAFNSSNFATMVPFPPPFGSVPLNVAVICQFTYMCVAPPVGPNIHANPTGYSVIATAFADVLP